MLKIRIEEKNARIRQGQVVGSCVIVQFVAPGVETTYGVLYENKEPQGFEPNTKHGFPYGGPEFGDKTNWDTGLRELLEELFDAPIGELEWKISELKGELNDAEEFKSTAKTPKEIKAQIAAFEKELKEARARAPEVSVTEDDLIGQFLIKNDRIGKVWTRYLNFMVFAIEMPASTEVLPGKEQFEALKLTADEIEDLIKRGEFFIHQAYAWRMFRAQKEFH